VETKLNITALIADLGGAARVAEMAGVVRTAPYGWVRREYVSSVVLEKIKAANPDLDLDLYFEEVTDDQDENEFRVGARVSG
jgi:hypothetical protein